LFEMRERTMVIFCWAKNAFKHGPWERWVT
jgi:hypothetical protein